MQQDRERAQNIVLNPPEQQESERVQKVGLNPPNVIEHKTLESMSKKYIIVCENINHHLIFKWRTQSIYKKEKNPNIKKTKIFYGE